MKILTTKEAEVGGMLMLADQEGKTSSGREAASSYAPEAFFSCAARCAWFCGALVVTANGICWAGQVSGQELFAAVFEHALSKSLSLLRCYMKRKAPCRRFAGRQSCKAFQPSRDLGSGPITLPLSCWLSFLLNVQQSCRPFPQFILFTGL